MTKSLALTFSLLLPAIAGCSAQPEAEVEGTEASRHVTDRQTSAYSTVIIRNKLVLPGVPKGNPAVTVT